MHVVVYSLGVVQCNNCVYMCEGIMSLHKWLTSIHVCVCASVCVCSTYCLSGCVCVCLCLSECLSVCFIMCQFVTMVFFSSSQSCVYTRFQRMHLIMMTAVVKMAVVTSMTKILLEHINVFHMHSLQNNGCYA